MENTHERVLYFINLIKGHKNSGGNDAREIVEEVNMRGNCYMFAKALQFVFPQAIIYSTSGFGGHAAAMIENKLYDIRGEVTNESLYPASDFILMTEEQEKEAATWAYSFKERSCYGLHDDNGRRVQKLDSLTLDTKNNKWKTGELQFT
ncbi:hypothetical protein D3C71_1028620 [compost metagenome]